jgi:hypothetical protein
VDRSQEKRMNLRTKKKKRNRQQILSLAKAGTGFATTIEFFNGDQWDSGVFYSVFCQIFKI